MKDSTILSVREAVAYMNEHYGQNIMSERHVSRCLSEGRWPCTHTPAGGLGITLRNLRSLWQLAARKAS